MDNQNFDPFQEDNDLSPELPTNMEPLIPETTVPEEPLLVEDLPEASLPEEDISEEDLPVEIIPVDILPEDDEDLPAYPESAEPQIPAEPDAGDTAEPLLADFPLFPEDPESSVEDSAFAQDIPAAEAEAAAEIPEELPAEVTELSAPELPESAEEEPFDLSILDDPAFLDTQEPAEEPADETTDQEYRDNGQDFDALPGAPTPEEPIPAYPRPVRKGRPKRKKGEGFLGIPNILATFVWIALILAIGVTAGRMMWICASDVLAFGRENKVVTVTIYEADTMEDITEKLYDAGLIRYRGLFNFYASIFDAREDIQAGIYDLNTRYDYHALVNFMSPRSSREVIQLTIPEGYTCRQIFQLLQDNRVCTVVDVEDYAASGELKPYWFLANVERDDRYCLEGFLFPDTYEFYRNSSPREALEKMLDNFEYRFSEEMRLQIDSLNAHISEMMRNDGRSDNYIASHQFTVREVAIVASMIEKETANNEESPIIASVIYNRLFNWGDIPAYLNIDASIIYALDGKTSLTSEDLRVDSPFNTYTNTGLTPTPISNPGLASLEAALNPATTNYYFYLLNPSTGTHQFSTTSEEHEAYRAQFAEERVG